MVYLGPQPKEVLDKLPETDLYASAYSPFEETIPIRTIAKKGVEMGLYLEYVKPEPIPEPEPTPTPEPKTELERIEYLEMELKELESRVGILESK